MFSLLTKEQKDKRFNNKVKTGCFYRFYFLFRFERSYSYGYDDVHGIFNSDDHCRSLCFQGTGWNWSSAGESHE